MEKKPIITLKRTNKIYEEQRTKTENIRKTRRLTEVKRKDRTTFTKTPRVNVILHNRSKQ